MVSGRLAGSLALPLAHCAVWASLAQMRNRDDDALPLGHGGREAGGVLWLQHEAVPGTARAGDTWRLASPRPDQCRPRPSLDTH